MSFMQNVNLCRFSCGVFSHSMEGFALEVTCSWFAVAEVRKQCGGGVVLEVGHSSPLTKGHVSQCGFNN